MTKCLINAENVEYLTGGAAFTGIPNLVSILHNALVQCASPQEITSIEKGNGRASFSICVRPNLPPIRIERSIVGEAFSVLCPRGDFHDCVTIRVEDVIWNSSSRRGKYLVYGHSIGSSSAQDCDYQFSDLFEGSSYIGITRRGMVTRFGEHRDRAKSGSPYLFHQALRESGWSKPLHHQIFASDLSFDDAMHIEEQMVAMISLRPNGLNMIPGGSAGLRFLAQNGHACGPRVWERREKTLAEISQRAASSGKPNPLLAALWLNDTFAAQIICSNPNNFDKARILQIRAMKSAGLSASEIADAMQARLRRVSDLLAGKTYARVA